MPRTHWWFSDLPGAAEHFPPKPQNPLDVHRQTLNPKPEALNPKPETLVLQLCIPQPRKFPEAESPLKPVEGQVAGCGVDGLGFRGFRRFRFEVWCLRFWGLGGCGLGFGFRPLLGIRLWGTGSA